MESLTHPHWESLTPATRDAFHLLSGLEKFLETKAIEAGRKRLVDLWE